MSSPWHISCCYWTAGRPQTHRPPTPPPYQGSGENKELPCLSPEANRDQPEEGRAAAPFVQGNCVLEVVHCKPRALAGHPAHLSTPSGSLNEGRADKDFCPRGEGARACPEPLQGRRSQSYKVLGRVGGGMRGVGSRESLQAPQHTLGLRQFPTKKGSLPGYVVPHSWQSHGAMRHLEHAGQGPATVRQGSRELT